MDREAGDSSAVRDHASEALGLVPTRPRVQVRRCRPAHSLDAHRLVELRADENLLRLYGRSLWSLQIVHGRPRKATPVQGAVAEETSRGLGHRR